jgi:lysozyme
MTVPGNKPQLTKADAEKILTAHSLSKYPVKILGIRGYYKKTMGNPLKNDVGIYDDALFVVSDKVFMSFNANTDPSVLRPGIAQLKPGLHLYKRGNHGISRPGGGYPALRPATPGERLPVLRSGKDDYGIAINIHKGSLTHTSSEGCQTLYPSQWGEFITTIYQLTKSAGQEVIPYVLVEY